MAEVKKILIRLPNWLGDMVMATPFIIAVQQQYPTARIDCIVKKGLENLLNFFPHIGQQYIFDKAKYRGFTGAYQYGLTIKKNCHYDLFFCLPNSFSAAAMAKSIAAHKSIGYKKGIHQYLFTHTYLRKLHVHRVVENINLLEQYLQKEIIVPAVFLHKPNTLINDSIIININSEAQSRRLPIAKAVAIINSIQSHTSHTIILIGSKHDAVQVGEVFEQLPYKKNIVNLAGCTTLTELIPLLASCKIMLSTDSGPAHVSNALGIKTLVLFGAGNEHNTAPYNNAYCKVIRLAALPCEPCVKNQCKLYDEPECLKLLDEAIITTTLLSMI